jgi:predicted amidohydrolase YtcJ
VGIQIALTRQDPSLAADAPVLNPAERVDIDTMVAAYTRMGAYLQHLERETGTLEVGKSADLIVLDRDIFEISPYEIAGTQVDLTVLEGQVVFAR